LQIGEIVEIRLIKNFKGKSKGYAYVEFKDEVSIK
jgi:RNA recognition motif-containing protein